MTRGGEVISVDVLVDALASGEPSAELLDLLDEMAAPLVEQDLVHRLVPFARSLAACDYTEHPMAALVVGVAACSFDRARGHALLTAGREHLAAMGDERGVGYGCFLEGLEALGEGRLTDATEWWAVSRRALGGDSPVDGFAMVHMALGLYAEGQLERAIVLAEEGLAAAQVRRDPRVEAIAACYLGLFRFWTGDFRAAHYFVTLGDRALARIEDPQNRYEAPVVHVEYASIAALRGEYADAEAEFTEALRLADELDNRWYEAIIRTARADFTARVDPARAVADVQAALDYFDFADETWFSHWAVSALVGAHRAAGALAASVAVGEALLVRPLNPLERGRAQLSLAETLLVLGRRDEAVGILDEAVASLDTVGARFWAAKARVLLAECRPKRREYLMRAARSDAGSSTKDQAWRRMLRGRGRLEVQLLGELAVEVDGVPVRFKTAAEGETLAMLALAGRRGVPSDAVIEQLWPDADWARVPHRLDNLVSSLRRTLLPTARILRTGAVLSLDIDDDECDVMAMVAAAERLIAGAPLEGDDVDVVTAALGRPLLGGPVGRWVVAEQDRIDGLLGRLDAACGGA